MATLTVHHLPGNYAILRRPTGSALPDWLDWSAPLVAVTSTAEELSIVCPMDQVPRPDQERLAGPWRVFKVAGPLDFAEIGILAGLTAVLARADVSVFAISTYDTDYLLVPADRLAPAKAALAGAVRLVEEAVDAAPS